MDQNKNKTQYPHVLKNGASKWPPFSWDLDHWCTLLKESVGDRIQVRVGSLNPLDNEIQWERKTRSEPIDINKFFSNNLTKELEEKQEWAYFDYKYMAELFPKEILDKFDWSFTGLTGRNGHDTTLWIGTKGAHTPCHQDSYGYNLVVQLIGSKTWILVSPEEYDNMAPTRVPYEESSVYSNIKFQDLSQNSKEMVSKLENTQVYKIILEPGDVLFVPRHWWHTVQNTSESTAVSVNTWVPCQQDMEVQLQEALVRIQAAQTARLCNREELDILLNPNEEDVVNCDIRKLIELSEHLAKQLAKNSENQPTTIFPSLTDFIQLTSIPFKELLNLREVDTAKRRKTEDKNDSNCDSSSVISMYKVLTSKPVIEAACKQLIKKFKNKDSV